MKVNIFGKIVKIVDTITEDKTRATISVLLDDWSTRDLIYTEDTIGEIPNEQDWAYISYIDDGTCTIVSIEPRQEDVVKKVTYEEQQKTRKHPFDRLLLEISLKSAKVIQNWEDTPLREEPIEQLFEPESCTMKIHRGKIVLSPHTASKHNMPPRGYGFGEIRIKECELEKAPHASTTLLWKAGKRLSYTLEITGEKQEIEMLIKLLRKHPNLPH